LPAPRDRKRAVLLHRQLVADDRCGLEQIGAHGALEHVGQVAAEPRALRIIDRMGREEAPTEAAVLDLVREDRSDRTADRGVVDLVGARRHHRGVGRLGDATERDDLVHDAITRAEICRHDLVDLGFGR